MDDKSRDSSIMVVCQLQGGKLINGSKELLGEGARIASLTGGRLVSLCLGAGGREQAAITAHYGADLCLYSESEMLAAYRVEAYANALWQAIADIKPNIVMFSATQIGRNLAPYVAARLRAGLTADCVSFGYDETTGKLLSVRPTFGGNVMATIVCTNDESPQMVTVRQGVFASPCCDISRRGEVRELDFDSQSIEIFAEILRVERLEAAGSSIEISDIVVSGGRGVKDKEGWELLERLAERLGGAVGGSRAAFEEGNIPQSRQVGQTGKTIRPKLYIACGISGAVQHLAGMKEAGKIIAINTDMSAPIFQFADYGIVGDYKEVIRRYLEEQ